MRETAPEVNYYLIWQSLHEKCRDTEFIIIDGVLHCNEQSWDAEKNSMEGFRLLGSAYEQILRAGRL